MSVVGIGVAQGLNAREVAMKAAQEALDQIGTHQPAFGIFLVSREYHLSDLTMGLTSLLGDFPLWGFNTILPFTDFGEQRRSVLVALFGGTGLKANVMWMPDVEKNSQDLAAKLVTSIHRLRTRYSAYLASMDASVTNLAVFEEVVQGLNGICGGCLPAGDHSREMTLQVARNQFGSGALSLAMLGGKFKMGVGFAHGWEKTGISIQAIGQSGVWLKELDSQVPVDFYSRKFGCDPGRWLSSPQAEFLRLYAWGISSQSDDMGVRLCSPLRIEDGGVIRLTGGIPESSILHLMVGSRSACLAAIDRAAKQAFNSFRNSAATRNTSARSRPLLALVFIDLSWRYMFETQPYQYLQMIKNAIGDIPIIGAYSLGQIAYHPAQKPCRVLNQGIVIQLIGEEES